MMNKYRHIYLAAILLCFSLIYYGNDAIAQNPFPAFPPDNVTNAMDHDQMLWQMGIIFPDLPPKLQDPNRPADAWPANAENPEGNWTNDKKYTITRSPFGLWNNYSDRSSGFFPGPDSSRLGDYPAIDLLKMHDGRLITSAGEWWSMRRPEILKDLQEQLYGIIPPDSVLPSITWIVSVSTGGKGSSSFIQKDVVGKIDISRYPAVRNNPQILFTLRTPANATGPVPVMIVFGGFGNVTDTYWNRAYPNGWGICIFNPGALQPDNGAGLTSYLIGLVNKGNWRKPTDWGTLGAWSWGISRIIDFLETDKDVNSGIIGLTGHSRYGKATLVALAYEPRLATGFPSDAGSLGTKMNRRHWGQDLENSTGANEYHWMAGTFFKWAGELNPGQYLPRKILNCPVDAHSLLALCAPRPVLLNGGTNSSWTDPYGQFLTTRYATPVYELLGKKGIVMNDPRPIADKAYIDGTLAFRYHNGGHTDAPDWPAFFEFAARQFDIPALSVSKSWLMLGSKNELSGTFTVNSNKSWSITSTGDWLKINPRSSSGIDSVTVTASQNRRKARSAGLLITVPGLQQPVEVFQASRKPSLKLPVKDLRVGESAGSTVTFDIISGSAWNITGGANWLTVSDDAGAGNNTITITALPNLRVQTRTAELIVTSPGSDPIKVTVTQAEGLPTLNIRTEAITLSAEDNSKASIMIISNTAWTLKCSEPWLSANNSSGTGFSQVVIRATENKGPERSASVTVTVPGIEPRTIAVTQKAGN